MEDLSKRESVWGGQRTITGMCECVSYEIEKRERGREVKEREREKKEMMGEDVMPRLWKPAILFSQKATTLRLPIKISSMKTIQSVLLPDSWKIEQKFRFYKKIQLRKKNFRHLLKKVSDEIRKWKRMLKTFNPCCPSLQLPVLLLPPPTYVLLYNTLVLLLYLSFNYISLFTIFVPILYLSFQYICPYIIFIPIL